MHWSSIEHNRKHPWEWVQHCRYSKCRKTEMSTNRSEWRARADNGQIEQLNLLFQIILEWEVWFDTVFCNIWVKNNQTHYTSKNQILLQKLQTKISYLGLYIIDITFDIKWLIHVLGFDSNKSWSISALTSTVLHLFWGSHLSPHNVSFPFLTIIFWYWYVVCMSLPVIISLAFSLSVKSR